jgi:hypothetical protein
MNTHALPFEFKNSLVYNPQFRRDVLSCADSKGISKHLELFDAVQDWMDAETLESRKYIAISIYMTYIESSSNWRVPVPMDIVQSYGSLVCKMIQDSDFYPEEQLEILILQVEHYTLSTMITYRDRKLASQETKQERSNTSFIQRIKSIHKKWSGSKLTSH